MVKAQLASAQAREAADPGGRRSRLASPTMALVLGALVLALMIADVPLAGLAHQSLDAAGGSVPVWITAPFAAAGFVVAWRKPGNPLGWIILGTAVFLALSEDASYYAVADYRLRHGGLPLGWLALLTQPAWAPGMVLFGLALLLFPDGRPPSPRLGWMVWVYAAVAVCWITAAGAITVDAILATALRWTPAGTCCSWTTPSIPLPGGSCCRMCSSRLRWPAGWCRWPLRLSATGAPANAVSS